MDSFGDFFKIARKDGLNNWDITLNGIHYTQTEIFEHKSQQIKISFWKIGIPLFLVTIALTSYLLFFKTKFSQQPQIPILSSPNEIMDIIISQKDSHKLESYLSKYRYQDVSDDYGWTPLHWAHFLGNEKMIQILIKSGASQEARSTQDWFAFPAGSTPQDISIKVKDLLKYSR